MTDDLERFTDRAQDRAGHPDRGPALHAVRTTLRALGSQLGGVPPALHDAIPRALRVELVAGERMEPGQPEPEVVYQQVAEHTGLRVGVALELVQSAVAELAELLAEPSREHLRERLPASWAALVIDPRPRSQVAPAPSPAEAGSGHTLASGRPGGTRPLADSSLPGGQNDSIATSDDPHAGGKLATTHGPGPREEQRTLAEGRPGSRHSMAGSD